MFNKGTDGLGDAGGYITKMVNSHLEKMYLRTTTQECRDTIKKAYVARLVSEIDEHGPWQKDMKQENLQLEYSFKNTCPPEAQEYVRGDTRAKPAEEIRNFYFILGHKHPKQIARIINRLQHPNHVFAVHFDGKADPEMYDEIATFAATQTNVMMSPTRHNVTWGGYSMVQAMLDAMELSLKQIDKGVDIDFWFSLAETSYPIRTDDYIRKEMATYDPDANYLGYEKLSLHPNEWFQFLQCDNRVHRVGRMPFPNNIELMVGSQWLVMTPPFMEYVVRQNDQELVEPLKKYMQHIRVPDEFFFQVQ
jgi:hypothetical protein